MGQTSKEQVMRKNPNQPVVRIVIEPRISTRTVVNLFAATSIITIGSMIAAISARLVAEVLEEELSKMRVKVVKEEETKDKDQSSPRTVKTGPVKKEKMS
jgi:hypothetical protein